MPYLEPEHVTREFSRFAIEEIRPAIDDDEQFVEAQVGSMASTMRFLSGELQGMPEAVDAQHDAAREALAAAEEVLAEHEATAAEEAVTEARERVAAAEGRSREVESTLVEAVRDALEAVDDCDDEVARAARDPLYGFLDTRVESQLRLLGRRSEGE